MNRIGTEIQQRHDINVNGERLNVIIPYQRDSRDAIGDTPYLTGLRLRRAQLEPDNKDDREEAKNIDVKLRKEARRQMVKRQELREKLRGRRVNRFEFQITESVDLFDLRQELQPFNGQNLRMRIFLNDFRQIDIPLYPYRAEDFGKDIMFFFYNHSPFDELRDDLNLNGINCIIVKETDLVGRSTFTQVFKDSESSCCFFDSIRQGLHQKYHTKIDKYQKKYSNGVTRDNIQEIVEDFHMKINLKTLLPIPWLKEEFIPTPKLTKSGKPKELIRTQELVNSRPHHVEIYMGKDEVFELDEDAYFSKLREVLNQPLFVSDHNSFTCASGSYKLKQKELPTLSHEYRHYLSTRVKEGYIESDTIGYQSLEFLSRPRYFKNRVNGYEYDMVNAYLQFPHFHGGYLIQSQIGYFTKDQIEGLIKFHDSFVIYVEVMIESFCELHKKLGLVERFVCHGYFLESLVDCEYHVTKYEIRSRFKLDIQQFKMNYLEANGSLDGFKSHYVKEFGRTARKLNTIVYDVKGIESQEFLEYLQSKVPTTEKYEYQFQKGNYDMIDEKGNTELKDSFSMRVVEKSTKGCPQILNDVSLYCYHRLYQLAKTQPIDCIMGITLDSLILTDLIQIPEGFALKHTHTPFEKEFHAPDTVSFASVRLNKRNQLPTPIVLKKIHKLNYVVGMGGAGKTFDLIHEYPYYFMICSPTKLLRDVLQKTYSRGVYAGFKGNSKKSIIAKRPFSHTHHRVGGFQCEPLDFEGIIAIDEMTTLTQAQIDKIIELHPNSIIYILGDIHTNGLPFQNYTGEQNVPPIKYSIKGNIIHYTNDRRSKDQETKDLKLKFRQIMIQSFEKTNDQYYGVQNLIHLLSKYRRDTPTKYDLILTTTRRRCDIWTHQGYNSKNSIRTQGMTINHPYFIDLTHSSLQGLYTILSRCERISDITFIDQVKKGDMDEYLSCENEPIIYINVPYTTHFIRSEFERIFRKK
jgi:hypothetical protein